MTDREKLLDKYYKGETSLDEEMALKQLSGESGFSDAEQDMFGYFEKESAIPDDLESSLFLGVEAVQTKRKERKMRWYSITSAAAVVAIVVTVFINVRNNHKMKIENDFLVMEQALFQVSESLQPEEQDEMFILWVDDDVEIIVN